MYKSKLIFFIISFLFLNTYIYSQDTINLSEIKLSKLLKVKPILKKIQKNLLKNADTTTYNYKINQQSIINIDTLFVINDNVKFKIKSFDGSFIKIYPQSVLAKISEINKNKFPYYIENSTPIGWISNYPVRKNLNTVNLDFFQNYKEYKFSIENVNEFTSILHFSSDSIYKGRITYNKITYIPSRIEYEAVKSYDFSHSSFQNLKTTSNFKSVWKYINEKVDLKFVQNNGKISLSEIEIIEQIENFNYKSFDKKGKLIFEESNNFSTSIKILRNE